MIEYDTISLAIKPVYRNSSMVKIRLVQNILSSVFCQIKARTLEQNIFIIELMNPKHIRA